MLFYYIIIMETQEPEYITLTNGHHIVETTREDLMEVEKLCAEYQITLDYYLFEFMIFEDETQL